MTESRKATQPKFPMDAAAAKNQIESTLMLREVPKHRKVTDHSRKNQESDAWSFEEDPRWLFFNSPQNRDKQYFVLVRGASGKDPRFDNTLEYLGNFDKIVDRNLYGSNLRDTYRHYTIWFKNAGPMTSHINENDELYYSTEDEEADRRKKTEADRRLRERNSRRFRSQEVEKQDKEESRRLSEVLKREEEYRRSKYVDNQDEDEADRQIRATFNFMDSEMKGIIDVRELKAALLAIGFEVHKDDIRRLYHYINKDLHDGNITLNEYRKMVYKLWEEVSMSGPKKFSSNEKHDASSRLMREVLNFEDWREEHTNEKKEYDDELSYDDDREVIIRLKNSKPKSKDVKYTSASPKLETDVFIRPTHTYGEFRKDAEYIGDFDPTKPQFHNTNFTHIPLSKSNEILKETRNNLKGDFDPTKPQFHNTNFTNVPLSKPNILLMKTHNGLKGGRKKHNKKTRKYFKKYTKTKNTKTKNKRLKYKKV
jgi:hypothetical protein